MALTAVLGGGREKRRIWKGGGKSEGESGVTDKVRMGEVDNGARRRGREKEDLERRGQIYE